MWIPSLHERRGRSNFFLNGLTVWNLPKPVRRLHNPQYTPSVTLPTQIGTTDTVHHSQLNVPFGRAGFFFFFWRTHGVRRLSISSEIVVVTTLHNSKTRVHITLGLSGFFKGSELSHSALSALSFCIPFWDLTVESILCYVSYVFPTVLLYLFSWTPLWLNCSE